ncbi:unnamed protein product, partial [marine sediment metagenome]
YTSYTLLKIEDVKAIRAYLFSLPAVNQPNRDNSMMFPFNQRWGLIAWKKANFTPGRMKVDNNKDQAWNRGAYLVEALGHCGECHTPRNITMGLKQGERYSGASLEGWTVFNITSDKVAGIGNWSKQEIVQYLRSGRVAFKAQAAGPMAEVIENSTRHLSDGDLDAMAHYIATLEAKNPNDETHSRSELGTI